MANTQREGLLRLLRESSAKIVEIEAHCREYARSQHSSSTQDVSQTADEPELGSGISAFQFLCAKVGFSWDPQSLVGEKEPCEDVLPSKFFMAPSQTGIHMPGTIRKFYSHDDFKGKGHTSPINFASDLSSIHRHIKTETKQDDRHVVHAMEYAQVPGQAGFAYTRPVAIPRVEDQFQFPSFPDRVERPTHDQAKEFLNSLVDPEASHHGTPVKCYSGGGRCSLVNPTLQHPGYDLSVSDIRDFTRLFWHIAAKFGVTGFHCENNKMRSLTVCHHGFKIWLSIWPTDRGKFENVVKSKFGLEEFGDELCTEFVRHLGIICSPDELDAAGIRYKIRVQGSGEFVVTEPDEYHMVVSYSPSIATSINFQFDDEDFTKHLVDRPTCPECGHWSTAQKRQYHTRQMKSLQELQVHRDANRKRKAKSSENAGRPKKSAKTSTATTVSHPEPPRRESERQRKVDLEQASSRRVHLPDARPNQDDGDYQRSFGTKPSFRPHGQQSQYDDSLPARQASTHEPSPSTSQGHGRQSKGGNSAGNSSFEETSPENESIMNNDGPDGDEAHDVSSTTESTVLRRPNNPSSFLQPEASQETELSNLRKANEFVIDIGSQCPLASHLLSRTALEDFASLVSQAHKRMDGTIRQPITGASQPFDCIVRDLMLACGLGRQGALSKVRERHALYWFTRHIDDYKRSRDKYTEYRDPDDPSDLPDLTIEETEMLARHVIERGDAGNLEKARRDVLSQRRFGRMWNVICGPNGPGLLAFIPYGARGEGSFRVSQGHYTKLGPKSGDPARKVFHQHLNSPYVAILCKAGNHFFESLADGRPFRFTFENETQPIDWYSKSQGDIEKMLEPISVAQGSL